MIDTDKQRAISRREFISRTAYIGAGIAAGSLVGSPFILGCTTKSSQTVPRSELLQEVVKIQKAKYPFPQNPVAITWDPSVRDYPLIKNAEGFMRKNSNVYPLVEKALMLLNPENPENPLSGFIKEGDSVVIKPNWSSQHKFPFAITHPSVLLPIIDYAVLAGARRIRVVEAPMTLSRLQQWFWGRAFVNIHNLITLASKNHPEIEITFQDGNDDTFTWVKLDHNSELMAYDLSSLDHDGHNGFENDHFFDVPDSSGFNPKKYERGLYAIANSYLDADVFINVSKLKTHQWTGLTAALKNLMGLNVRSTSHFLSAEAKEYYFEPGNIDKYKESPMRDVPHFDRRKEFSSVCRHVGFENDILWRTLADLNKTIRYTDKKGRLHTTKQRRYLNVVDAIVGTDRHGPVSDSLVQTNCILAGFDPVKVDAICCKVMGWDHAVIKLITNCSAIKVLPFGNLDFLEDSIVGANLASEAFNHFYIPPLTYKDELIAPYSVRAKT